MIHKTFKLILVGLLIATGAMVSAGAVSAGEPKGPVKFAIPAGAGGANDLLIRGMKKILESTKLVPFQVQVKNRKGGGGAVAWAEVNRHKGDPNRLVTFMPNLLTNELLGAQPFSYKNFTPIAVLLLEDACYAVNPKGKINSAKSLIKALKTDPSKVRFGFANARGNHWHQGMAVLAKALGVDSSRVRSTVFGSGGKARTALLGGHTDLMVGGFGLFRKFHKAGRLKCVATATEKRLWGIAKDVPTWRELGYDIIHSAWRGVMAPAGLDKVAIKYWEDKFREVVKHDVWKEFTKKRYFRTHYMGHADTSALFKSELVRYKENLKKLGMLK